MTRRGNIQARSRLREAERRIELARSFLEQDPRRAAEEAGQATRIAEDAISQMSHGDSGMGYGGPVFGPGGSGGMGGLGGLGGIILGGLGGLARGGGGMSFPGGRRGGGGFGRSRGGSFGSGGGRSRGGRW
jgi:hypothetical protein